MDIVQTDIVFLHSLCQIHPLIDAVNNDSNEHLIQYTSLVTRYKNHTNMDIVQTDIVFLHSLCQIHPLIDAVTQFFSPSPRIISTHVENIIRCHLMNENNKNHLYACREYVTKYRE